MAITAGIPNELFWELSIPEVQAVFECKHREQRAAALRAGLIAATIHNVHRAKGEPLVQPSDFLVEDSPREYMTVEESQAFLDQWAAGTRKAAHG